MQNQSRIHPFSVKIGKIVVSSTAFLFFFVGIVSAESPLSPKRYFNLSDNDVPKYSLYFNLGSSSPLGSFGSTGEDGDYANTGFAFNIGVENSISENFGVLVKAGFQRNLFNGEAFVDEFEFENINSYELTYGSYSNFNVLGCGALRLPIDETFELHAHGGIGFGVFGFPTLDFSVQAEDFSEAEIKIEPESAVAFAYELGADIQFNLSKKVALTLGALYSGGSPEFDVKLKSYVNGGLMSEESDKADIAYNTLQILGGLKFNF